MSPKSLKEWKVRVILILCILFPTIRSFPSNYDFIELSITHRSTNAMGFHPKLAPLYTQWSCSMKVFICLHFCIGHINYKDKKFVRIKKSVRWILSSKYSLTIRLGETHLILVKIYYQMKNNRCMTSQKIKVLLDLSTLITL